MVSVYIRLPVSKFPPLTQRTFFGFLVVFLFLHSKTKKLHALIEEEIQQGKPAGTVPRWQEAFKEFAGAKFVNMQEAIDFSLRALPHLRARVPSKTDREYSRRHRSLSCEGTFSILMFHTVS